MVQIIVKGMKRWAVRCGTYTASQGWKEIINDVSGIASSTDKNWLLIMINYNNVASNYYISIMDEDKNRTVIVVMKDPRPSLVHLVDLRWLYLTAADGLPPKSVPGEGRRHPGRHVHPSWWDVSFSVPWKDYN